MYTGVEHDIPIFSCMYIFMCLDTCLGIACHQTTIEIEITEWRGEKEEEVLIVDYLLNTPEGRIM